MTVQLLTAAQVDKDQLDAFLQRTFGSHKADFLREHGEWLHGGNENRWVLLVDGVLAGYCAVIPTQLAVHQEVVPAIWWVDIMIAPEFRGQKLQSHFDKKLQEEGLLKVGFPNEIAAKIHRKHQWGVREDLKVLLCPLRPMQVGQVRNAHGWHRFIYKAGAAALSPMMGLFRLWLKSRRSSATKKVEFPDADLFARIFAQTRSETFVTTNRGHSYFRHRFLEAPYQDQLAYYTCALQENPTHLLIARTLERDGNKVVRILDLVGDLEDSKAIRELVFSALADAASAGITQVTIMVTLPQLLPILQKSGFIFKTMARFCWLSSNPDLMQILGGSIYFTLADSDNDEIA